MTGRLTVVSAGAINAAHLANHPAEFGEAVRQLVFLDMLDADAHAMQRLNQLLVTLPPGAVPDLRPVDLLLIRPSMDLSMITNEFEAELPRSFRFATRGLGTRETKRADLLATILFQPGYIARMIEIGEHDGEQRRDEIAAFLSR